MRRLETLSFLDGCRTYLARRRILVVNGHPDCRPERYCGALCEAYEDGARSAGLNVQRLDAGGVNAIPGGDDMPAALEKIGWADRLTVVFPLWLDRPPVPLTDLFGRFSGDPRFTAARRKTRTVITMDMPAFAHRDLLRNPDGRGTLPTGISLPGFPPGELVFIGGVSSISPAERTRWLLCMHRWGARGL